MNRVNTINNTTEDMIDKLQSLKGKRKLKFYKNINSFYNEMENKNFQTHHEDPFSRNAQDIPKIYHEVSLLMNFLQTKPKIRDINNNYYDLYYTVIKKRKEKDYEEEQKEIVDDENVYNNFNDIVIPNHYVGVRPRETILR